MKRIWRLSAALGVFFALALYTDSILNSCFSLVVAEESATEETEDLTAEAEIFYYHGMSLDSPKAETVSAQWKELFDFVRKGNLPALKSHLKEIDVKPVDVRDENLNTLLHIAAVTGKTDMVDYLIDDAGIPVDTPNNAVFTPLMYCVYPCYNILLDCNPEDENRSIQFKERQTRMAKHLIQRGVQANQPEEEPEQPAVDGAQLVAAKERVSCKAPRNQLGVRS